MTGVQTCALLKSEFLCGDPRRRVQPHIGLTDPSQLTNSSPSMSRCRSSSEFCKVLWPGSQVRERLNLDRLSHHAHIVWVHFGKLAGFTIVVTNPDRRLSWTRWDMR